MRKLRRRSAWWRQAGWLRLDMKPGRPIETGGTKPKRNRGLLQDGNADLRGGQRTLPIRRIVVVSVVLVRAIRIVGVIRGHVMNPLAVLQQCVR